MGGNFETTNFLIIFEAGKKVEGGVSRWEG